MRKLAVAAALTFAASLLSAQTPRILHANVAHAAAAGDLAAQIRGAGTPWVGYSVPAVDGYRVMCCFQQFGELHSGGTCRLADDSSNFSSTDDDLHPAAGSVAVLYHLAGGTIDKVRTYSLD